MARKLRMGMVGGGRDAFIGNVHRFAARLDGEIELVAGAFSADPEKAKRSGEDFLLDPQTSLLRLPNDGASRSGASGRATYRLCVDSDAKPSPFPGGNRVSGSGF